MAGILTRDQIVTNGLELGGNPALTTLANAFLDLTLDHLARAGDWSELRATTTVQADAAIFDKIPAAALPTDYHRVFRLRAAGVKSNGFLRQIDYDTLWLKRQRDAEAGATPVSSGPTEFATDTAGPNIYVYQKPDQRLTYDLIYYRVPIQIVLGTEKPWFGNHLALTYAVAAWAKDYERDTVEIQAYDAAMRILGQQRTHMHDQGRSDAMILRYDENYFPSGRFGHD